MEDDADEKHKMNPSTNPRRATTTTSIADTTLTSSKSVAMPPSELPLSFPSSQSSLCSTPLLDEVENVILKQLHTLHTYDSGFSDWTPDSAPSLSSLSETPSFLHGTSLIAESTASIESESDSIGCFQRHQRRSWPMRTRKLSFQSPDTDANKTPVSTKLHASAHSVQQGNECCNTNNSNSTYFHSEEEVRLILSKSSIDRHSPVNQFLERSRSFSRSPLSSVSDDLESSFHEMSLEENSSSNSSSNQSSPTALKSSSPVFSFSLQHVIKDNILDAKVHVDRRKLSHLSWENVPSDVQQNDCVDRDPRTTLVRSLPDQNEQRLGDILPISTMTFPPEIKVSDVDRHIDVVDFASSLSLVPVVVSSKHVFRSSSSSTTFHEPEPTVSTYRPEHDSSSLHIPSSSFQHQCHCLNARVCSCYDNYPSTSVVCGNFIKSPTKRISNISQHCCLESVSPQKMRRLKSRSKPSCDSFNFKRDLFGNTPKTEVLDSPPLLKSASCLVRPRTNSRSVDERTPQFLHIESASSSTSDNKSQESSISKSHFTPVSRWRGSKHRNNNNNNVKIKESCKEGDAELVNRICLKFSPSVPSQLIGRHVGVKKFDILGELQQHNFIECVEIILSYIPDSDLLKITLVSDEWKSAVLAESKAYRRYKALCRKISSPRKARNQAEKENVGKFREKENVPMTSSKGHLTAIQPQFVVATDATTPLSIPQKPELLSEDCTRNCPHCQCRAVVVPSQDRAICMSDKCAYDFCTKCFFPFHHPDPCKPLFHCASKTMLAGSKKSKKNLKRLKNL